MAMSLVWFLCLICHNIVCMLGSTLEDSFKLNLMVGEASFTKTHATRHTTSNMYLTKVRKYSLTVELLYYVYPLMKIIHSHFISYVKSIPYN